MARAILPHPVGIIHPRGSGLIIARPAITAPPPDAVVWNTATSDANYQLSLDRVSAKTPGKAAVSDVMLRANTSAASGYFEIVINVAGGGMSIGLANPAEITGTWVGSGLSLGFNSNGNAYHSGGVLATYTTYTTSTIGVCRKGNFAYFSKDGVWQGGSDPSAGTGGVDVSTFTSDVLFPALSTNNSSLDITARFTAASMAYPIPTGVTAWDGTSLSGASSTGTGASTEDADTTSASGTVAIAITGASTETADTASANGTASVSATGASTEGADTTAGVGTVAAQATGATTEATDTSSASGTVAASASGASTEGTDTAAGTATASVAAAGASAEPTDTTSGGANANVTGSGAGTEGTDSSSGSGTVAQAGSTGTGAATEGSDSTVASGAVGVTAAGASAETSDTDSGIGALTTTGSGAANDNAATGAGAGAVFITGSGAANDNADTTAGSGTAAVHFQPDSAPPDRIGHVGARRRTGMASRAARTGQVIRRR